MQDRFRHGSVMPKVSKCIGWLLFGFCVFQLFSFLGSSEASFSSTWSQLHRKAKEDLSKICSENPDFSLVPHHLATDLGGVKFHLYELNDVVSDHLLNEGRYEHTSVVQFLIIWETFLPKYLEGNQTHHIKSMKDAYFLDVGANIGLYSLRFASKGAKVIAFEPLDANQELFRQSICKNNFQDLITDFHTGVGSTEQDCWMVSLPENIGDGMTLCQEEKPKQDLRQRLPIRLLDSYLYHPDAPKIALMKVDIEGFEPEAIVGGLNFLKHYPPFFIQMEIDQNFLKTHGKWEPFQFLQVMWDLGYNLRRHCKAKEVPKDDRKAIQELLDEDANVCWAHDSVKDLWLHV